MSLFEKIERAHNTLADKTAIWFPFQFLKPRSHQFIKWPRKVLMTLLFSAYTCVIWGFLKSLFQESPDVLWIKNKFFNSVIFFYIWFTLVTCFFWNRRAYKLQNKSE